MIETNHIYPGDCLDVMASWPENFVDTVITDPPYGLSFMGKDWDHGVPGPHFWAEALRICKPGAMLLAFGGTRTYHRLAVAIEDAGWEIRDCLMWLYGSGFPKSLDISKAIDAKQSGGNQKQQPPNRDDVTLIPDSPERSTFNKYAGAKVVSSAKSDLAKQWSGWGTALKPAWEPIILAMKPTDGTFAENAEKWGVAGINVDGARIGAHEMTPDQWKSKGLHRSTGNTYGEHKGSATPMPSGRWPANLILDEEAAAMLDGQSGGSLSIGGTGQTSKQTDERHQWRPSNTGGFGDSGGASRFFYVAKSDRAERNEGCEELLTWESEAQGRLMDELNRHAKDISDATMRRLAGISWSTELSGLNITARSLKALTFTISTMTRLITELKTLNSSQESSIRGRIRDAIATIKANGLSLAESVAHIGKLTSISTDEPTGLALGASLVALKTLSAISDCAKVGNTHSTVKPLSLMKYLCNLTKTPTGGIVLDPFCGSGTTLWAAEFHNRPWIGIEQNPEYVAIANARIARERAQIKMAI